MNTKEREVIEGMLDNWLGECVKECKRLIVCDECTYSCFNVGYCEAVYAGVKAKHDRMDAKDGNGA